MSWCTGVPFLGPAPRHSPDRPGVLVVMFQDPPPYYDEWGVMLCPACQSSALLAVQASADSVHGLRLIAFRALTAVEAASA